MNKGYYLHIGNNYSVYTPDIVGIFDMDNTTVGSPTKKLLDNAEKEKRCIYTTYELPKSFIITVKNKKIALACFAFGSLIKIPLIL